MKEAYILRTIQQHNILPLTSRCNVSCIFCSHKNNPQQLNLLSIPPRTLEEVLISADFLDAKRKIVIGESATEIIEGEPFSHKDILPILQQVRLKYPKTPISLTTNGNKLTQEMVKELSQLQPLELTISLNSANPSTRQLLMGQQGQIGIRSLCLLQKAQIIFHGSLVAMPWLTGWEDMEQTVDYLNEMGAETIRVFLPGYTRLTKDSFQYNQAQLEAQLEHWVEEKAQSLKSVLLLEPPMIKELKGLVAGVVSPSPAQLGGIKRGDVITKVHNKAVTTRVEAFKLLEQQGNCQVELLRDKVLHKIAIRKRPGQRSGLVVDYDVSLEQLTELTKLLARYRVDKAAVMTSQWGAPIVEMGLQQLELDQIVQVFSVPSTFFGGSIKAAGLLVVEDFIAFINQNRDLLDQYALIILPAIAFNQEGRDLTGRGYWELAELWKEKEFVIN